MGAAGRAQGDLPPAAGEPGKFAGRCALGADSRGSAEAAQLVGDARRVEKGVRMPAVDPHGLVRGGDPVTAGGAAHPGIPGRPILGVGAPGRRPGGRRWLVGLAEVALRPHRMRAGPGNGPRSPVPCR